jgi:hypothetical protein
VGDGHLLKRKRLWNRTPEIDVYDFKNKSDNATKAANLPTQEPLHCCFYKGKLVVMGAKPVQVSSIMK